MLQALSLPVPAVPIPDKPKKLCMQAETTQLIIAGTKHFFYTIQPVAITNPLGFVRTILHEYQLTSTTGEHYKLYKTIAGNWFDMAEANPTAGVALLSALKMAITGKERNQPQATAPAL